MIPIVIPVRNNPKSPRCPGKMTREFVDGKSLLEVYLSKFQGRDDVMVAAHDEALQKVVSRFNLKVLPRTRESDTSEDVKEIWSFLRDSQMDDYKHICFLNACCPLIQPDTVDAAIRMCIENKYDALFSVKEVPELIFTQDGKRVETGLCFNSKFRQPLLMGTNSIIIFNPSTLYKTGGFWSDDENLCLYQVNELESYDIDTELDFIEAQAAWNYAVSHGLN